MNHITQLVNQLCPDGVEYKRLGDLGTFYGGLSGKSKADFTDGNAKFITYRNIYSNPALNLDDDATVKIRENERQNVIEYGDVLFTGSSETPDECGFSSVVTKKPTEKMYLNSFCFGYRLNDKIFIPDFLKHLFRSNNLRKQIFKTASGVTRYNVSKKLFAEIEIPVPPLQIQEEIVRVLDSFSALEAELEAELEARQRQYAHYRDALLQFDCSVTTKKLGDVCKVITGGEAPKNATKEKTDKNIYAIYANAKEEYGFTDSYTVDKDAVSISSIGAKTGTIYFRQKNFTPIIRLKVLLPIDETILLPKYLYYALLKVNFKTKQGGIPNINANDVKRIEIPIPPLEEQQRIVDILDKFAALTTDLQRGLPAELAARRKQYAHYRDALLTFKKREND